MRNGEFTERGLAKLTGVSQPHIHNVLKGIRVLSPALSDHILKELRLNVRDLCDFAGLERAGDRVPVVQDTLDPNEPYPREFYCGNIPFAIESCNRLIHPAFFHLGSDRAMQPELLEGDLLLVDRCPLRRTNLAAKSICLINLEGRGLARYARMDGGDLYLGTSQETHAPEKWRRVPLGGRDILELIRGRIVWIGRQMETPAGSAGEACPAA